MGTGSSRRNVGDTYGSHDDGSPVEKSMDGGVGNVDQSPLIDESLVEELKAKGTKFIQEDMKFVTKDQTGQIIWLEKGSQTAGLEHMKARGHDKDLVNKFGQEATDTARFLRDVIKNGRIVSNTVTHRNGRDGYTRVYEYNGEKLVLAGIGLNGFLVTAYPV